MPWKLWTYSNLTTELQVEKKYVCWFWSPKSKQNLATTETTTQNETLCLNILIWHRSDYGTTGRKKKCMLILNRVCHGNVCDYRNYSLIWHTCLENPELTRTWLRNYGSKKNMYVDFEALRASRIWRLQKLQHEMKHSFWHRSDYGTTGRKKNVCWFRNPNTASRIWRLYKLQPKMKQSCHGL